MAISNDNYYKPDEALHELMMQRVQINKGKYALEIQGIRHT